MFLSCLCFIQYFVLLILSLLVCPHYDAFICYAGPDKSFADEVLHYLEKGPYYMKVCIDYRDFLPGADLLETAAKAIEERCNKVLLILSENFPKCEAADFQAKIALSLSPGLFVKSCMFFLLEHLFCWAELVVGLWKFSCSGHIDNK